MCIFFQPVSRMYSTPLSGGSGVAKSDVFFVPSFHKEEEIRKKMRLGPDACEEDGRKHCLQIQAQELRHALAKRYNRAFFCTSQYELKQLRTAEAILVPAEAIFFVTDNYDCSASST